MARLHDQYREKVVPELVQKFGYKSVMEVPRITKITLNMGVGDAVNDKKNIDMAVADVEDRIQDVAGIVYASSFFAIAIVFNVMWRYAVRARLVIEHLNVGAITRQYMMGPVFYGILIGVAFVSAVWCLVLSFLIALYFALPPSLWARRARAT